MKMKTKPPNSKAQRYAVGMGKTIDPGMTELEKGHLHRQNKVSLNDPESYLLT